MHFAKVLIQTPKQIPPHPVVSQWGGSLQERRPIEALIAAHGRAVEKLSREIAEAIRALEK